VHVERVVRFCIVVLALLLSSCMPYGRELREQRAAGHEERGGNDYIAVTRYGCLGTCPDYTAIIYDNDTIHFEGRNYSSPSRAHVASASAGTYKRLLQLLINMNVWSLEADPDEPPEACKELVTDYPGVEIRVAAEGRTQSIRHYYGCIGVSEEPAINEIAREIDKAAGVKSRTKGIIWHAR
jgi:hypothetical protein